MSMVHVKGLDQLQKLLDQLPANIEKNAMRSALRQGANVIKVEVKANVPVDDGPLRDSVRVTVNSKGGRIYARVQAGNKIAFYAQMVEFGTRAHQIKPRKKAALSVGGRVVEVVRHPGAVAKPYMRPAIDARATDAVIAVGNQLKARLTKEGLHAADIEVAADER